MPKSAADITQAGVRRRRNRQPTMNSAGDNTVIKYSALGGTLVNNTAVGGTVHSRWYVPGLAAGLPSSAGPTIVGSYSTGKFLPGTRIKWEPSVSFTTSGRVLVGFTDNPEVISTFQLLIDAYISSPVPANFVPYVNAVRGLGSVMSFPVWQETMINFPTKLRRKRFDVNRTVTSDPDVIDRSAQTAMFVAVDGVTDATVGLGSFWYHDVVDAEGVQPVVT